MQEVQLELATSSVGVALSSWIPPSEGLSDIRGTRGPLNLACHPSLSVPL